MIDIKEKISGRSLEKKLFQNILNSKKSEFIAVYGRRRIGKTFLIHEFFKDKGIFFSCTGIKDSPLKAQLENFSRSFSRIFYDDLPIQTPSNWMNAFELLTKEIEKQEPDQKCILFFDELPWFSSSKSKFIPALDHYWNTRWNQNPNLILIVCGSAASWMLEHLVHAKGGLHNRITKRIHLMPFSLSETEVFLKSIDCNLNRSQILILYMAFGGVPHYLMQATKGKSAAQIIDEICFSQNGILFDEYPRLLASLFDESKIHHEILKSLFKKKTGLTKEEIAKSLGLKTGGFLTKKISELIESGFIQPYIPYGNIKKSTYFKLIDEYILFYFYWIDSIKSQIKRNALENYWMKKINSQEYSTWCGLSFEAICHKHAYKIIQALGINSIDYKTSSWRLLPKKSSERGAQIDMIIDRSDGIISLIEIKFCQYEYIATKSDAENFKNKMYAFSSHFKIKKQIQFEFVTTHGVKKNTWSEDLIVNVITLDDFF